MILRKLKILNKSRNLFLAIVLGVSVEYIQKPVKAFIPNIYQPDAESLKESSIGFAKTAAQLMQFGQNKDAVKLALLSVKLNPNDYRLWSILAEAQIRNKELVKAQSSLEIAKKLNPNIASLWFAQGSVSLQQNKIENAILLITKGLSLEPRNAGAYFQLGNARIMQSELDLALQAFKKANQIQPQFWEALNNEGLVLYEMNEPKKAIEKWRKVLSIKQSAEPMLALASALHQIEPSNSEIFSLTKTALQMNPNYVSSKYQATQLWGKKLQQASSELLKEPGLSNFVSRASANSD